MFSVSSEVVLLRSYFSQATRCFRVFSILSLVPKSASIKLALQHKSMPGRIATYANTTYPANVNSTIVQVPKFEASAARESLSCGVHEAQRLEFRVRCRSAVAECKQHDAGMTDGEHVVHGLSAISIIPPDLLFNIWLDRRGVSPDEEHAPTGPFTGSSVRDNGTSFRGNTRNRMSIDQWPPSILYLPKSRGYHLNQSGRIFNVFVVLQIQTCSVPTRTISRNPPNSSCQQKSDST